MVIELINKIKFLFESKETKALRAIASADLAKASKELKIAYSNPVQVKRIQNAMNKTMSKIIPSKGPEINTTRIDSGLKI